MEEGAAGRAARLREGLRGVQGADRGRAQAPARPRQEVEGRPSNLTERERATSASWPARRSPPRARPRAGLAQGGAEARHPVPRRRRRPRRQGHELRRHPRRRRPGRAGRALRRRGRRRAGVPRHHRLAREARHDRGARRRTADNVFIPFTIGGGIRSVADAQAVLDAGADKVSVNSSAPCAAGADRRARRGLRLAVRGDRDRRRTPAPCRPTAGTST